MGERLILPEVFCWTKFGTEAGEPVDSIFRRKEEERRGNGGVFLWGIGNSIGPSLEELLEATERPKVVFSPMASSPLARDTRPESVVMWRNATGIDGKRYDLPDYSLVTSSSGSNRRARSRYALVCSRDAPLWESLSGVSISQSELRNLRSGSPLGSSQVTAVVRRSKNRTVSDRNYQVTLSAELVDPFFVRLSDPKIIPRRLRPDRLDGVDRREAVSQLLSLK